MKLFLKEAEFVTNVSHVVWWGTKGHKCSKRKYIIFYSSLNHENDHLARSIGMQMFLVAQA